MLLPLTHSNINTGNIQYNQQQNADALLYIIIYNTQI